MSKGLKEKIESMKQAMLDATCESCYAMALDDILKLPELQQMIEKASQFDKMFEGLVVVKKCKKICQDAVALAKYNGGVNTNYCPDCNGTGTVSRPLTEEEKGEVFIYRVSKNDMVLGCIDRLFLPSGAKVVRGK